MEVSAIKSSSGNKFQPTDKELIQCLVCKAMEKPLPCEVVVKECDFYGKEPSELFEGSEEKFLYFFTRLKKKHKSGLRIDRLTGIGTWKGLDTARPIKDGGNKEEEDKVIGAKRSFTYRILKSDTKGEWGMTEYSLEGTNLERAKVKDYVICRIKRQKQEGKVNTEAMPAEGKVNTQATSVEEGKVNTEAMSAEGNKVNTQPTSVEEGKVMTEVMPPENCNHWLKSFAEKLLENQEPPEESEVEMVPNLFYADSRATLI